MPSTSQAMLAPLYAAQSKHSGYQLLHPRIRHLLGVQADRPYGRHEPERQRCFEGALSFRGARVLDIGANTGYFSLSALEAGARSVCSVEGNPTHAQFIAATAAALGLDDRLQVEHRYHDFVPAPERNFDLTLCLNVVHHLGDDFGDRSLCLEHARERMCSAVNALASQSRALLLQVGFNWKGNAAWPLFEGGQKAAMIEFIRQGTASHWAVEAVFVAQPLPGSDATERLVEYVPLDERNVARDDRLGEFLNRPVFCMRALDAG